MMAPLSIKRSAYATVGGVTLIELLVAITLGLVLIAGVIQVFLGNRSTQRVEQSVSRIQESGRLALDLMMQDLRKAGYHGCAVPIRGLDAPSNATANDFPPWFHVQPAGLTQISRNFSENSVRGFQRLAGGGWAPALDADINAFLPALNPRAGSDVLAIYYGEDTGIRVNLPAGAQIKNNDPIPVTWNDGCESPNDIQRVIVSGCSDGDLVAVTNPNVCGTAGASLQHGSFDPGSAYNDEDQVLQFWERQYFVADTGRVNSVGDNIFALYRRTNGQVEELIEGVEFMRVLYGQKLPNNSVRFVAPDDASLDRSQIVSVRLALLVAGSDPARDNNDALTYTLLDRDIGPATAIAHDGNRKMRRVFTATIELRNRLVL